MGFRHHVCQLFTITLLVFLAKAVMAQDAAVKGDGSLAGLRAEYDRATKAWEAKYSGLPSAPSAQLIERYDSWPAWSFLPRIVKLGTADGDAAQTFEALKWFVDLSTAVGAADREYFVHEKPVFEALQTHHRANPRLVELFADCRRYPTPARESLLRVCTEKGVTREVRGLACFCLAECLQNKARFASQLTAAKFDTANDFQKHFYGRFSPEQLTFVRSVDTNQAARESKEMRQRVLDEFDDVQWLYENTFVIGKPTLGFLIRLEHEQASAPTIGQPAPALTGKGLDGIERKLSDYKGKVLVLHFWATWCPPCVEKIPRLAELDRQRGKDGLCILGINYERDSAAAMKFIKEKSINWPSLSAFSFGESIGRLSPGNSWPSVIVIDHRGVLRYHEPEGDELDKAVETLLRERAGDE